MAQDEGGADLGEAAHLHLGLTAARLRPAESFRDALAQPLTDRIAHTRGDRAPNRGLARLAVLAHRPVDRDMRLDPARLQALEEGLGVIALVGAEGCAFGQALAEDRRRLALGRSGRQRRLGRRHEPVAVLHQDVAKIGQTALLPGAFAVRRASLSVVEAWVAFNRLVLRKSTSPLRPG